MKKYLLSLAALSVICGASAQGAMDAFQFSQPDLKGTARFMSMGGAFGALGGDLTTLNQNPAGIGVYRRNEIGFTLNLDAQKSQGVSDGVKGSWQQTKFYLNNIGFVTTINTGTVLRNFNMGFTYNKTSSFNRRYRGGIPNLQTSVSNYIAGIANQDGATPADLTPGKGYDPYNPQDGGYVAPWITVLGYNSYLINPEYDPNSDSYHWYGQFGEGTTGNGYYSMEEGGAMDEFNIALGGNFGDILFWGMDFGIINFNYKCSSFWGEDLAGAWLPDEYADGALMPTTSSFGLSNGYAVSGTGFNYKLGVILRPVQQLRLGLAMQTPTWYSMDESFIGTVDYSYGNGIGSGYHQTNNGNTADNNYNFRTPWRLIASAAVVGERFIISADYEWANYQGMQFSQYNGGGYIGSWWDDWYYPWWMAPKYEASPTRYNDSYYTNPYETVNNAIDSYYKTQNTWRFGAEFRVSDNFSLRAGYCYQSSPVDKKVRDGEISVGTAGTRPSYSVDDDTNYVTAGFGYRNKGFYLDMAYVYKNRKSKFRAFTTDPDGYEVPTASITSINNQVVLSMGFKF